MSRIVVAANIQLVSPCRQHDTHTSNTVPWSLLARHLRLWVDSVQGDFFVCVVRQSASCCVCAEPSRKDERQHKRDLLHAARSRLTFTCITLCFCVFLLFRGIFTDILPRIDQGSDTIKRRVFSRSFSFKQYIKSQTMLDFNFIKEFSGNGAAV